MVAYQGVDSDGADNVYDWIAMTSPQLFLGPGQIGLMGESTKVLYFKNDRSLTDTTVSILVGRTAEITGG